MFSFFALPRNDIPIFLLDYSKIHSLKCQTPNGQPGVEVTILMIILTKIEMDVIKG